MVNDRKYKKNEALLNSKSSQWCYVNTDNEFKFMSKTFIIDEDVESYKVYNKAGLVEEFTNESYMEEIMVVLDVNNNIKFYDQNFDEVDNDKIRVGE